MLTYNTHKKPLILPEYGRIVQSMVDHALTIEDREERTRCAYAIVDAMKKVSDSAGRDPEEAQRRFWDHLAVMSDFKLEIDWPFELPEKSDFVSRPSTIPYDGRGINKFRYGRNLVNMIDMAASMPPGNERDAMITLVANQMKKESLAWDDEGFSDERIFNDLSRITEGAIRIEPGTLMLCEFLDAPKPGKKKKKKN